MLKIYNTLSRKKETFRPIEANKVGLYVCGMTVYDYCHIGHARVMIVFDTVARYFRHSGYQVTYVRNITDIDDKIIQRANENEEPIDELTSRYIQAMHEDEYVLGNDSPDREPRATRSMGAITTMIQQLMDNDLAYQGTNGDVFYAVSKFSNYGQLSGKNIDELQSGERVEVDQAKRNPLDFVLWKTAKADEPAWNSPWGNGRPGWHIECSAMSTHCLGDHFDIHGGGMDLQFPHHENEIAQSEGATGHTFVNTWMHNGFVRVDEEKMSKSLGNFFTVREVMKQYRPETIRLFILSSHYRSPLNYSDEQLTEAESALTRLYTALRGLSTHKSTDANTEFHQRFTNAMDDDFNTPIALSVLFELAREINRIKSEDKPTAAKLAALLKSLGKILGLLQKDPEDYFRTGSQLTENNQLSDEDINQLIEARNIARQNKDWITADKVRDELKEAGVVLEDIASGTEWRRT